MIAEILSVGTELLLGHTDTNASYMATQLARYGIDLCWVSQVGDNRKRLTEAIARAWGRSQLILITGGLGPTEDDLTREAIADALGEPLAIDPDQAREQEASYVSQGRSLPMPPGRLKQSSRIPSASFLPNRYGTAPGWLVAKEDKILATMPGVPVEMSRMWEEEIVPRLRTLGCITHTIHSRTLKMLGIGESLVEEEIRDLIHSSNPTAATYATRTGVHVRITAKAAATAEAEAMIAPVEREIRTRLEKYIYGIDEEGIGTSVNRLLRNHGLTLATFEIATAGNLSALLTAGESDSGYRGGIVLARESDLPSFCRGTGIPLIEKTGDPRALQALAVQAKEAFYADVGLVLCAMDREAGTSRGGMITFPVAVETPWRFRHDEDQVRTTTPAETRHRMTLAAIAFLREVLQSQTYLA